MSVVPTIKVVVQKNQLLTDLNHMDGLVAEYSEFLRRVEGGDGWETDALSMFRAHYRFLNEAKISLRVIDLVSAVMRDLLGKLKVNDINLKLGGEARSLDYSSRKIVLAGTTEEANQQIENLIARVNSVAENAPMAYQERIRYLLLSTFSLMKASVSGDADGIEDCMNQINLLTSTKESQALVREIAVIARDIYNTLNSLSDGIPVIDTLSESTEGTSDAAEKLKAVIVKLEEAAFGNLDHLELLSANASGDEEICERILAGLRKSQQILGELKAEYPEQVAEFTALQDQLGDQIGSDVMMLRSRLHENSETYLSLTANQGFQDLTGQTLKKTIHFIESLELELMEVLRTFKPLLGFSADALMPDPSKSREEPAAEVAAVSETPQSQDDVDQLLADLGF